MTLQAGGNIGGQTPDVGLGRGSHGRHHVAVADLPTGGVRINFVPQATAATRSPTRRSSRSPTRALQGDNFIRRAAGAPASARRTRSCHAFDLNESFGGPIKRDKVWFWFSTRYQRRRQRGADLRQHERVQPERSGSTIRTPTQPGVNKGEQFNSSIRVTWQANAEEQDRRHLQGRQVVQLPEPHQRDAWRLRPPATAASRACARSTRSGPRRSPTGCCSRRSACTCSSAGATCTCARQRRLDRPTGAGSDPAADDRR